MTLYFKKTRYDEKRKKNVLAKGVWYFNNVASAIKKYANDIIDFSEDIKDVLSRLDSLEKQIEQLNIKL